MDCGADVDLASQPALLPSRRLEGKRFRPAAGGAAGWHAVCKGSPGALGLTGLPPKHPLQAPHDGPLRGLDGSHAEEQQGGEDLGAESVRVDSRLPLEQEP